MPTVPKMGKTGIHWLLEAIFIVASVGLGFRLAGYRESRAEHELVGRGRRMWRQRLSRTRQFSPHRLQRTVRGWTPLPRFMPGGARCIEGQDGNDAQHEHLPRKGERQRHGRTSVACPTGATATRWPVCCASKRSDAQQYRGHARARVLQIIHLVCALPNGRLLDPNRRGFLRKSAGRRASRLNPIRGLRFGHAVARLAIGLHGRGAPF